jgi:inorganic pyrophosphatase
MSDESVSAVILIAALTGLAFAYYQYTLIADVKLESRGALAKGESADEETDKLTAIHSAIEIGARAFLWAEYKILFVFCTGFSILIFVLISWGQKSALEGFLTAFAYILGSLTSTLSGYIGMTVAVFSNVRTTIGCQQGFKPGFNTAFRGGGVMGFALTGLGLLVLYVTMLFYKIGTTTHYWATAMDMIAGFGLGGSTIALFGRVGGGIYTKAADVGADLVGKVVHGIPEDSPKNPAVVADLVGDNVGDIAGMGADLFGSFAESTCAALVIAAQNPSLYNHGWGAICFPLLVSAAGIWVCIATSFIATHINPVTKESDIDVALRIQMVVSAAIMIPATYIMAVASLPDNFEIIGVSKIRQVTNIDAFVCIIIGTIGGMITGLFTDYYTSTEFEPVRDLAKSCITGASTNIIYGLALGYLSVVAPVFVLAAIVYIAFQSADVYGVALSAVGMLGALATGLTIDGFGPIADNAGGIAEMGELHPDVRDRTDALDAAGNTTAAIGKGFAIGSAALVSLALFGAFTARVNTNNSDGAAMILEPMTFAFMLVGAALPYWFSALTMKSVGLAAMKMIKEVQEQFSANPNLLNPDSKDLPDYAKCVAISTQASLGEMIAPGALVILAPLITGTFFGVYAVYGLLTGGLLSGVQLATSMSNTGGAWDNAKKLIGKSAKDSEFGGKGSDAYKAAVVGDTVGDPMKDTSGPSLNILMKLMAIISLVFADYFWAINHGKGLFSLPAN